MIEYTSINFYYFVFFAVLIAASFNKLFLKKHLIAALNLTFQLLFFYFLKIHLVTIIFSLLLNWTIIQILLRNVKVKNFGLIGMVLLNLCVFVFLKYEIFQPGSYAHNLKVFAFIGISFYTFRLIALLIDLKREVITKVEFIKYYNYLTFFPSFLSGPVDRYQNFSDELDKNHNPNDRELIDSTYRFVLGIFKKIVLAGLLHDLSIDAISTVSLESLPFWKILLSLYIYTAVLYLDFSGYSDMAIGLAQMLGLKIPENFNKPYLARNIQDFWTRWHMSFMTFLRDYVYYPFQLFLVKKLNIKNYLFTTIISTSLILFLASIWHGDKIQYVYYGLYHALCFSLFLIWRNFIQNKKRKELKIKYVDSVYFKYFSQFLTLNYFAISLLFFSGRYLAVFK
jgi:membrane protein involved in D-alanine export